MNHHLRFADVLKPALACLALATPVFTSCQSTGNRLLSVSESVPPKLARDTPYIHYQCYFFTAPDGFQLLENTKGAHVAGIYSPQDGDKLVASLKQNRKFDLKTAPSLTSRQGQSGTIEAGREFIYPTEYEPPKIAKPSQSFSEGPGAGAFPVTPATPTKFETVHTGTTIKLKGRKSSEGEIAFEFDLKRTTFLGFINYGSPITTSARTAFGKPVEVILTENRIEQPVFDTKRLSSRITLADGHYLAIGGLRATPQPQLENRIHVPANTEIEEDQNLFLLIKVKAVGPDGP